VPVLTYTVQYVINIVTRASQVHFFGVTYPGAFLDDKKSNTRATRARIPDIFNFIGDEREAAKGVGVRAAPHFVCEPNNNKNNNKLVLSLQFLFLF
jgi:hypothetical protein